MKPHANSPKRSKSKKRASFYEDISTIVIFHIFISPNSGFNGQFLRLFRDANTANVIVEAKEEKKNNSKPPVCISCSSVLCLRSLLRTNHLS